MDSRLSINDGTQMGFGKGIRGECAVNANVEALLISPTGEVKDRRTVHNTMTTLGLNSLINLAAATPTQVKPGWMEVGSGTGGTTKLNAVITGGSGNRTALDSSTNTAATNAVLTMICTFAPGYGTGAITECGIFSVVTADTVAATTQWGTITKAALDTLVVTWTITLS
jgi:hypothetical protein